MIVVLAAIGGLLAGGVLGFIAVLALLEHLQWNSWFAIATAAIASLPIGIAFGVAAGAGLILVMYPEFDWTF